jgi:hypothetical protein
MKHVSDDTLRFVRWLLLPIVLISACSDDDTPRSVPDGGGGSAGTGQGASGAQGMNGSAGSSGSSGSTSTGGSAGNVGGTGGTLGLRGRDCGSGKPCSPGAKCNAHSIESGFNCNCDPSGHFFCDSFAGGGGPPFATCTAESSCKGEPCQQTNGYCTRSCGCDAGCSTDCSGQGPAEGLSFMCDLSYCSQEFGQRGGCSVQDGTCNYEIDCNPGGTHTVTGSCP